MSQDDIDMARGAYAAFNRGDLAGALERIDPEIEWRMADQFTREARVFRGHDGVREVFRAFTENFDDFHSEPHDFLSIDGRVVVPVLLAGREKGGGAAVAFELVHVWTIRSARAVRLDVFTSLEQARAAIEAGRAEDPPPTGPLETDGGRAAGAER